MNLNTYTPQYLEATEMLEQIKEFLNLYRNKGISNLDTMRWFYYYDKTVADCAEPAPYGTPSESMYSKGLMLLRNLHKLWHVDFEKLNIVFDYVGYPTKEKIASELIYGIGGILTAYPSDGMLAQYVLTLDDLVMEIHYYVGELRDVVEKDGVRSAISVNTNIARITVRSNTDNQSVT